MEAVRETGRRRPAAACALVFASMTCAAQESAPAAPPPPAAGQPENVPPTGAPTLDGSSFAGIRLDQAPVSGPATIRAGRVHTWESGACRRLLLEGEVRIQLGEQSLTADRGVAWIEPFEDDRGRVLQVFMLLTGVGSPDDGSGQTTIHAAELPVRGVLRLDGDVEVVGDLVINSAPVDRSLSGDTRALMTRSREAFVRMLRRYAGQFEQQAAVSPFTFRAAPAPKAPGEAALRWQAALPAGSTVRAPTLTPAAGADAGGPGPGARPSELRGLGEQPAQPLGEPRDQQEKLPPPPPATTTPTPAAAGAPRHELLKAPIMARSGVLSVGAGHISHVKGEQENAWMVTDGVTLLYKSLTEDAILQMTARRAVIFLDPAFTLQSPELPAEHVRGIFLEGEVTVSDGTLHVRAPQVYYDLINDRAVMLDAVFWTYDQVRALPLYVRAKEIHQESARQFRAKDAVFTNSGFLEPELAIGASQVTITRRTREMVPPGGSILDPPIVQDYFWAEADGITVSSNGAPFFYWPTYSGDPAQPLIRDMRVESSSTSGAALKMAWNVHHLIGLPKTPGVSAELQTDVYAERGVGLGHELEWGTGRHSGRLSGYMLPSDTGEDSLKPGTEINRDGKFRGIITGEDRMRIDENWTLQTELSHISDPAYVDAFIEDQGETRREYTNRLLASRHEDNTHLSGEVKGPFNDFISNEWLLESQGYTVTKLPEAVYVRQADDLLPGRGEGLLTWSSEYRAGRVALAMDEADASERGLTTVQLSQRALGINPDQSPADRLRAMGLNEDAVGRLDSRHEVAAKMKFGPVHVNPFVAGRATFYDNDFESYSGTPGGNDNTRIWTSAGVRLSTTLTRVYDNVDSRLLDIHRLRHIVEPNATFWIAGTSVEAENIPVYDEGVDRLADGSAMKLGISQILQTKRGGPGRWVNTDLLKVNTDFVFSSEDVPEYSPIGRFFDSRPEYSSLGDYFTAESVYRMTDITSLTASTIYDLDAHSQDANSAGIVIRHAPGFSTSVGVRYLNPQDSTLLDIVAAYDLTDKYSAVFAPSYDTDTGEVQSVWAQLRRKFSAFEFNINVSYNDISGETGVGFLLRPLGARSGTSLGVGSAIESATGGGR